MQTLIESLRQIIGAPAFFNAASNTWDYGAMCEYFACVMIVLVVISSVFRIICKVAAR